MKEERVLLNAHPKTGQHWFLFVLHHYTLLQKGITKDVSFKDLGIYKFKNPLPLNIKDVEFMEGMPKMKRSEYRYQERITLHEGFEKVLYLCRNPFDVMISYLEWFEREDLEAFVKERLPRYVRHVKQGLPRADVVIWYEDVRNDPNVFKEGLLLFHEEIEEDLFMEALNRASFTSIKKINPKHARDGRVGQFKERMSLALIQHIKKECKRGGIWKWIKGKT